jgi:hypothetical protein
MNDLVVPPATRHPPLVSRDEYRCVRALTIGERHRDHAEHKQRAKVRKLATERVIGQYGTYFCSSIDKMTNAYLFSVIPVQPF